MTTKIQYDDDEIIIDSENQFRKIIQDFGQDGRVWFCKSFIRDYINALYLKIERLEKELKEIKQNCIVNSPTADVAPIVHGHWITRNEGNPFLIYGECSLCGFEQSLSAYLDFCPNCGAKMDEVIE